MIPSLSSSSRRRAGLAGAVGALASLLPAALTALPGARADPWNLTTTFQGRDFIDKFDFWGDVNASVPDPTRGLVVYQGRSAAEKLKLVEVDEQGLFNMRVDTTEVQLQGRPSVRITSQQTFNDGIFVINVTHIPTGCSVWPAFWMVAPNTADYPVGGEIDILENANDQFNGNLVSIHTGGDCVVQPSELNQTGSLIYTNCTVDYTTGNNGCRSEMNGTSTPTWGAKLNAMGGGLFAAERSMGSAGNGVRVWYWPQAQIPADLKAGSKSVDPSNWGEPAADFPIANMCHSDFGPQSFVFDQTICGDWAGNTYNERYNGSSYNQSYWTVDSVRAFTSGGGNANAANSPNTSPRESSSTGSGSSAKSGADPIVRRVSQAAAPIGALAAAGLALL